jgi:O-antigen/teichoic acid export membrane protein
LQRLSLKKNFIWNLSGNVIYNAFQWGILALLNKWGGTGSAGLFVLGLAVANPITQLCSLQLRGIFISDVKEEHSFGEYLGTRIIWNVIGVVLCAIFALLYYPDYESMLAIVLMGIACNVQSSGEIFASAFQKNERLDIAAKSLIIKGGLNFLGMAILFWLTKNVCLAILWIAISRWLVIYSYDRRNCALLDRLKTHSKTLDWNRIKPIFSKKTWFQITLVGIPMGINMAFVSLTPQIPRYILPKYHSIELLGIFGSISYVLVAGNMVMNALSATIIPRFAKYYHFGKTKELKRIVGLALLIALGVGGVGMLVVYFLGDFLLSVLYTSEYVGYGNVLFLLSINATLMFIMNIIGALATSARFFKIQPLVAFIVMFLTLILSFVLIPEYSIYGAVWAILGPHIVSLFIWLGIMFKIFNMQKKTLSLEDTGVSKV